MDVSVALKIFGSPIFSKMVYSSGARETTDPDWTLIGPILSMIESEEGEGRNEFRVKLYRNAATLNRFPRQFV